MQELQSASCTVVAPAFVSSAGIDDVLVAPFNESSLGCSAWLALTRNERGCLPAWRARKNCSHGRLGGGSSQLRTSLAGQIPWYQGKKQRIRANSDFPTSRCHELCPPNGR